LFLLCVPHDDKITPTEKNKQYWVCHFAPCKPETCSPPDSIVTGRLNKIEQKPCRLHVAISLTAGKLDTKWSGSGPENPHGAVLGAAHIRTRWMWSMPLSPHWVAHVLNGRSWVTEYNVFGQIVRSLKNLWRRTRNISTTQSVRDLVVLLVLCRFQWLIISCIGVGRASE
jgi:hypothetical protein